MKYPEGKRLSRIMKEQPDKVDFDAIPVPFGYLFIVLGPNYSDPIKEQGKELRFSNWGAAKAKVMELVTAIGEHEASFGELSWRNQTPEIGIPNAGHYVVWELVGSIGSTGYQVRWHA